MIGSGGGLEGAKQVKVVERYKFPIKKYTSHGDLIYSVVTIVNNTVLHV